MALHLSCGVRNSSGKVFGYGLDGTGSIPGVGGLKTFCVQTLSAVHSALYKMSIGDFPRGKGGREYDLPSYLFLVPWLCLCGSLLPHPLWAVMGSVGDKYCIN